MASTDRSRPRRFWWITALIVLIAAGGLVLILPQLVSRGLARRVLVSRAGRLLAPGSLEAKAVRVGWFGPTEIDGAVLRDERKKPLIAADRAVVGCNLWQILFRTPETITLDLPGASVEIERFADGRIDLVETLRPIVRDDPQHRVVIKIVGGRLEWRDPALAEPIRADRADIAIDLPRDPQPIAWDIALEHRSGDGGDPGRVVFKGSLHRPGEGGATISLEASRWPWAIELARGHLDGRLSAERREANWSLSGEATTQLDGQGADAKPFGPIRAAWQVESQGETWTARRLELAMPYARLDGGGTVEMANGSHRLDLKGSLSPDWPAIEADLRRDVEPNARVAGRPRGWRLTGSLGGNDLVGELGIQLDGIDIYGLRLSETSVVLHADRGRLRFDPIDARLNEGTLHLEPEILRPQDGPARIKFGPRSTITNAAVNDEVSHRVLSYVAPVLDGATRVRGRVSVGGLDAEIPLGESAGSSARVEGNVRFDDVRFLPGPLAEAILDLVPNERDAQAEPMLVLRDPISFRIADRKVYQQGLMIPVGRIGSASLEGSVDFEKRLDLVARFRVNAPRADRPVLAALLNNARFELPIRGTLKDPRIDEEDLKNRLKSLGSDMLGNSIAAGADGLMKLLEGLPKRRETRKPPADVPGVEPEPAPRPTPEERREMREQRRLERLEKKAQRRMRRDGIPD